MVGNGWMAMENFAKRGFGPVFNFQTCYYVRIILLVVLCWVGMKGDS